MAVTNGWGQGVENNTIEWGKGKDNATNDWGKVYETSASGDTLLEVATPSVFNTKSLELDGVDDGVNCGNDSSLQPTGEFSVSAWFKTAVVGDSGHNFIYSKLYFRTFILANSGRIRFDVFRTSGSSTQITTPSGTSYSDGNWHHIVTTFKVSDTTRFKIYIDGALIASAGGYNNNVFASTHDFFIGVNSGSNRMHGNVDEVAFWKTKLTLTDVQNIYNSGAPNDISALNPISWWRFEEGSGTTATDSGSGGNDGTINNGATYSSDVPT